MTSNAKKRIEVFRRYLTELGKAGFEGTKIAEKWVHREAVPTFFQFAARAAAGPDAMPPAAN
jgi:hypothetical protein